MCNSPNVKLYILSTTRLIYIMRFREPSMAPGTQCCAPRSFQQDEQSKNRTKEGLRGQDLYLVMELGQDWSTVLLYYKLTSSVAG